MRNGLRISSPPIELPCTVLLGPEGKQKLTGVAVKIDPSSVVLRLQGESSLMPHLGDWVDLNVHLPVNLEHAQARDLSVRARVVSVLDVREGVHELVLNFRRAKFTDRGDAIRPQKARHARGWEM